MINKKENDIIFESYQSSLIQEVDASTIGGVAGAVGGGLAGKYLGNTAGGVAGALGGGLAGAGLGALAGLPFAGVGAGPGAAAGGIGGGVIGYLTGEHIGGPVGLVIGALGGYVIGKNLADAVMSGETSEEEAIAIGRAELDNMSEEELRAAPRLNMAALESVVHEEDMDDLSHGQYVGSDELEPMARIEPQEMGDEVPDDLDEGQDLQEGDFVEIDMSVGGGRGEVVEVSPKGTHAIIELTTDQEDGLERSDRVAVHMSDLRLIDGEEESVDVDDLDSDVDDVPYESNSVEEEGCGCPAPEELGHGISKGIIAKSKDNLLDDEPPKLKIAIIKRKNKAPVPGKLIDKIKQAMGLESTVNEEWDEEFEERERMIHNTSDHDGWDPDETIEWHGDAVVKAAADFLDNELLHDKVNSLDDIHPDLRDDLAAMVIHDLQRQGHLPKRLDYNDHLSERDEYKEAIEEFLADHFQEMVDHAEDKAVERGDRPPADYGASEFPEGDVERVPPGQGLE